MPVALISAAVEQNLKGLEKGEGRREAPLGLGLPKAHTMSRISLRHDGRRLTVRNQLLTARTHTGGLLYAPGRGER